MGNNYSRLIILLGILVVTVSSAAFVVQSQLSPIQPVLSCVLWNDDGSYTALFSYENPNNLTVTIPEGENNTLLPVALGDLPTVFEAGTQPAFAVTFYEGSSVAWVLDGDVVTASADVGLRCGSTILLPLPLLELTNTALVMPPEDTTLVTTVLEVEEPVVEQVLDTPSVEPSKENVTTDNLLVANDASDIELVNVDGLWSDGRQYADVNDPRNLLPECYRELNTSNVFDRNEVFYGRGFFFGEICERQSGFSFDGGESLVIEPGQRFIVGEYSHINNILRDLSPRMNFVNLSMSLEFGGVLAGQAANFQYRIQLEETPNNGFCAYGFRDGFPNDCNDRITVENIGVNEVFIIDDVQYTLDILGFVPGTAETCDLNSGTVGNNFVTEEQAENFACIIGQVLVAEPSITLSKTLNQTNPVAYASDVTFNIVAQNNGNTVLQNVVLNDPQCSVISSPISDKANADFISMEAGETWTYTCTTYDIVQDFTNVAQVNAISVEPQVLVSAQDDALVQVLPPPAPIVPMVECIVPNPDGRYTAYFTYENSGTDPVTIPLGVGVTENYLINADSGVPVVEFQTGQIGNYPNPAFSATGFTLPIQWVLKGGDQIQRIASADQTTPLCLNYVEVTKLWDGDTQPPDGVGDFRLVLQSTQEMMTCSYQSDVLICDGDGRLAVPVTQTYNVSEENIPGDWTNESGIGDNFSPANCIENICQHIVENEEDDIVVEPICPATGLTIAGLPESIIPYGAEAIFASLAVPQEQANKITRVQFTLVNSATGEVLNTWQDDEAPFTYLDEDGWLISRNQPFGLLTLQAQAYHPDGQVCGTAQGDMLVTDFNIPLPACPVDTEPYELVTFTVLRTSSPEMISSTITLPEDSDGTLIVQGFFGHPEQGCPASGHYYCGQAYQQSESLTASVADFSATIPDQGTDVMVDFDYEVALSAGQHTFNFTHVLAGVEGVGIESIGIQAVYCATPTSNQPDTIIEPPVEQQQIVEPDPPVEPQNDDQPVQAQQVIEPDNPPIEEPQSDLSDPIVEPDAALEEPTNSVEDDTQAIEDDELPTDIGNDGSVESGLEETIESSDEG